MPELPEVEVLVRHLGPALLNKTIRGVEVRRLRIIAPGNARRFEQVLRGARFAGLSRRGKYLLFTLSRRANNKPLTLVGHLGMTGRMYLTSKGAPLPRHAAVVVDLGRQQFVFEDTRYFGKLTLDTSALDRLGPEPLGAEFNPEAFARGLAASGQAIKVKLLDQSLVAGVGNIYASEALFRAKISPGIGARRLTRGQVERLCVAIREVLAAAIKWGSTVPLDYAGTGKRDGLFYYGSANSSKPERFLVYDREGQPCRECGSLIKRIVQAARSTYYCPHCQQR